jgi:hypothetical protein
MFNRNLGLKPNLILRVKLENRGKIAIEWLDNTYEDDLGTYFSSGAKVWLDDELILDRYPSETSEGYAPTPSSQSLRPIHV